MGVGCTRPVARDTSTLLPPRAVDAVVFTAPASGGGDTNATTAGAAVRDARKSSSQVGGATRCNVRRDTGGGRGGRGGCPTTEGAGRRGWEKSDVGTAAPTRWQPCLCGAGDAGERDAGDARSCEAILPAPRSTGGGDGARVGEGGEGAWARCTVAPRLAPVASARASTAAARPTVSARAGVPFGAVLIAASSTSWAEERMGR
mmetsp:Transcript_56082/g.114192  ORF Transcript_56082/g.114192 Transcript_56082/m.114192 type:complete len:203 (-) Transcript_56082:6753-7361(-)